MTIRTVEWPRVCLLCDGTRLVFDEETGAAEPCEACKPVEYVPGTLPTLTLEQVEALAVAEQYKPGVWTADSLHFAELCAAALDGNAEALRAVTDLVCKRGTNG